MFCRLEFVAAGGNMRFPKLNRRLLGLALALPVLFLAWRIGDTFIEDGNFRVSSANLYRSGQLRGDEWDETLQDRKYRTVLNLRGAKPGVAWYDHELRFAADHGIAHFDFALSANREPTLEQMDQIVAVMRDAPKPILIHCKNGSDRSGLVAALYLNGVEGLPADTASRQLSLWYGHFPWLTSRSGAMDVALSRYFVAHPQDPPQSKVADLF